MKINLGIILLVFVTGFPIFTVSAQVPQIKVESGIRLEMIAAIKLPIQKSDRIYNSGNHRNGNMAMSPDSNYFVARADKSGIYILNLKSGEIKQLSISHDVIYAWYSSDSSKVGLSAEYGERSKVTIVDLRLGQVVCVINSLDEFNQFSFSSDGERVATSRDEFKFILKGKNFVNLWNASDGSLITSIKGCGTYDQRPVFSPDARFLVLDCKKLKHKPTKIFSAQTGEERASFAKKYKYGNAELWSDIDSISTFSPDSKTVVSIFQFSGIRLWDIESGGLRTEFNARQGSIYGIAFSREGNSFATNGFSTVIRLWNIETGKLIRAFGTEITKSPAFFIRADISPDGRTLVGVDKQGRVTVWDIATGDVKFTFNEKAEKEDFSVRTFFGLEGKVLYIWSKKSVKAIDMQTRKGFGEIPNPTGLFYVSDDGRKVFIQNADGISEWVLK